MKKIILFFALLVSLSAISQDPPANLDSIVINGLSLKIRDWAYIIGNVNLNDRDSISYERLRKTRLQIQVANPQGWNVFVTVDSLPGRWLVNVYQHLRLMTSGKYEQVDPTTKANIKAKTQLTYWYDQIDAQFIPSYINDRNTGKYVLALPLRQ